MTQEERKERADWLKDEMEKRDLTKARIAKIINNDPQLKPIRRSDMSNWLLDRYGINNYTFNFLVLFFERYDRTIGKKKPSGKDFPTPSGSEK